jgi:hypothetical protein
MCQVWRGNEHKSIVFPEIAILMFDFKNPALFYLHTPDWHGGPKRMELTFYHPMQSLHRGLSGDSFDKNPHHMAYCIILSRYQILWKEGIRKRITN